MGDVSIDIPGTAYTGDEPFLFVSYAHADAREVYPEISRISLLGCRVWFDEGIDPGNEWPEEIANALTRSAMFIVFITPKAVNSKNVRNEINFALKLEKTVIAIHLEETELPAGLDLQMSSTQAVLKWRMGEQGYVRKLKKTLPDVVRTPEQDMAELIAQSIYKSTPVRELSADGQRPNWHTLPAEMREPFRARSRHLISMLTVSGYDIVSAGEAAEPVPLPEDDIDLLSRMEHDRWSRERLSDDWTYAPRRDNTKKQHPCLIHWRHMDEALKEYDRHLVGDLPETLFGAGYLVVSIYNKGWRRSRARNAN